MKASGREVFKTSSLSYKGLMQGDVVYKVPLYQRNYRWKEAHWQDLWDDILDSEKNDTNHYMGSIVLKEVNETEFEIIDGQQRFTTITLIALAVKDILQEYINNGIEPVENSERINKILMRKYIGEKTIDDLAPDRKLFLNKYDDSFFNKNILNLDFKNLIKSKMSDSEKLLFDGFFFFKKHLKEKFSNNNGSDIIRFFDQVIANNLIFISINVLSDTNAYLLFETLNARGIELSVTDLLKNYIFSLVSTDKKDLKLLENRWDNIVSYIKDSDFPTLLRYYLNSQNEYTTEKNLFRTLRSKIKTKKSANELLEKLEFTAQLYNALSDSEHDLWKDKQNIKELKETIEELTLFENKTFKVLGISAYKHFDLKLFCNVLKLCKNIIFRYTIISKGNPKNLEMAFCNAASKIHSGQINKLEDVYEILKHVHIPDEDFKYNFSQREMRDNGSKRRNLIKYIFKEIEKSYGSMPLDYTDSSITIEHISPKAINKKSEGYVDKLGNMILLDKKSNQNCSNRNFIEKIEIYKNSQYNCKHWGNILDKKSWNISDIQERQAELSIIANKIWNYTN